MRKVLAAFALFLLPIVWLSLAALTLFPSVGFFWLVLSPCIDGRACGEFAESVNQALLFGRTYTPQLHTALAWGTVLLLSLSIAAAYVGARLIGMWWRRKPYSFVRGAAAYGILVGVGILLTLPQVGEADAWISSVELGCPDITGALTCSDVIPTAQVLVPHYREILLALRLWGTLAGSVITGLSGLLLLTPPEPTPSIVRATLVAEQHTQSICETCGAAGFDSQPHQCILNKCEVRRQGMRGRQKILRRPVLTLIAAFGLFAASASSTHAQTIAPEWRSSAEYCSDVGVYCVNILDSSSTLNIRNLNVNYMQPRLQIRMRVNIPENPEQPFTTIRVYLPDWTERIGTIVPTSTSAPSCEIIVAALGDKRINPQHRIGMYLDFTRDEALNELDMYGYGYCTQMNLVGTHTNNPPIPGAQALYGNEAPTAVLRSVANSDLSLITTIFERLRDGVCVLPEAVGGRVLGFHELAAQIALFVADEFTNDDDWQFRLWSRYGSVGYFREDYAAVFCLLNLVPTPLQAKLANLSDLMEISQFTPYTQPLIDQSTGAIAERTFTVIRLLPDGASEQVLSSNELPSDFTFITPGQYRMEYRLKGVDMTFNPAIPGGIVSNPSSILTVVFTLQQGTTNAAATPVPVRAQTFFADAANLPVIDENTLTLEAAFAVSIAGILTIGIGWGVLQALPQLIRRPISVIVLIAAVLILAWVILQLTR